MTVSTARKSERLDRALVSRGLVSSRTRATALIKEGGVRVDGVVIKEPDFSVETTMELALKSQELAWVSRGALKLLHALDRFKIDPKGKIAIDVGASTGGFTEALLSRGAKRVYALDVGRGQLAKKLSEDPRVINMEGTHINKIAVSDFSTRADMIVVDVSFISLEKVLPKVKELLRVGGVLVALIKPQFEVGKQLIGKGVVQDPKLHSMVAMRLEGLATELGFSVEGVIASPILGGNGNKEFLLYGMLPKGA